MRPVLEQYGVEVVALSPDSVDLATTHRARDGLSFPLLCDPDLQAIRVLGLVHNRGLVHKTFYVLGIPLGYPTGFREMAIPTTILVDEGGVVRWIDQATDYRLRGDRARIEAALDSVFTKV